MLPAFSTTQPVLSDGRSSVTIIYNLGPSGEAKGVVLNAGNIAHMLAMHRWAIDLLMDGKKTTGPGFSLPAVSSSPDSLDVLRLLC